MNMPKSKAHQAIAVQHAIGELAARALWSPDLDGYAAGYIPAHSIRCVLCELAPCACPEFGAPEYYDLLARQHGGAR